MLVEGILPEAHERLFTIQEDEPLIEAGSRSHSGVATGARG